MVHHSDRGIHYACTEYRELLARHSITSSMSRKGDCWDNAVASGALHRRLPTVRPRRAVGSHHRRRRLAARTGIANTTRHCSHVMMTLPQ
jgi:transposase InsO family protein